MTLEQYLERTGESGNVFAKRAGIGQSSISRYLADGGIPWAVHILKIEQATSGKVGWKDWVKVIKQAGKLSAAQMGGKRPKISFTQFAISIPMPQGCDPDPISAQMPDALRDMVRAEQNWLCEQIIRDCYQVKSREPYVPPPEPEWEMVSSMACFSCGRRGVIERQENDDPELCGDHHHCNHCGVLFDLWVESEGA